jgi:hypothetical protein
VAVVRTLSVVANFRRWVVVAVVVEAVAAISTSMISLGQECPVKYGSERTVLPYLKLSQKCLYAAKDYIA